MSLSDVQLLTLAAIPVAVVRRQARPAELSRIVPECCGTVWNVLRAQKVPAGRNVAIYWDGSILVEAGVELQGPFTGQGEVVRSATPSGSVATVAHFGPYSGLGAAHAAIREWSQRSRNRLAGPNWEIYGHWQDVWNTDPSQIRTDVFYQVASA